MGQSARFEVVPEPRRIVILFRDNFKAGGESIHDCRSHMQGETAEADSGYIQTRPDLKNIGPLPDFLKSEGEFRNYFNKKGKFGAGPWATWDDLRKQMCNPADWIDCFPVSDEDDESEWTCEELA